MALYENYDALLLLAGLALVATTLGAHVLKGLNLSKAFLYLPVGLVASYFFADLGFEDPLDGIWFLERVSEAAVIVSLVVAGLKVGRPLGWARWRSTARLILLVMPLSIGVIALTGHFVLGLALGPAILLGAVLAPTDPVTAGGVQLVDPDDDEEMRFGLTTEAGLNDGFAFPFVYLGLYATTRLDEWGEWAAYWLFKDLLYATTIALVVGWFVGKLGGRAFARAYGSGTISSSRWIVAPLSLLFLCYGLVEVIGGYGFLSAFALALAFRRAIEGSTDALHALARASEGVEQLLEAALLVLLGSLLAWSDFAPYAWGVIAFALVAILVARPAVVLASTVRGGFRRVHRTFWAWFGIRGIGTVYYLSYALRVGVPEETARVLFAAAVGTVLVSSVLHGVSLAPLMRRYDARDVQM